jgi:hypothetical protein
LAFKGKADLKIVEIVQAIIDEKAPGLELIVVENSQIQPLPPPEDPLWHKTIRDELQKRGLFSEVWISYGIGSVELHFLGEEDQQTIDIVKSIIERESPGTKLMVSVFQPSTGKTAIPPWYHEVYDEIKNQGITEIIAWMTYDINREVVVLAFTGETDQQIVDIVKSIIEQKSPGTNLFIMENQIRV